MQYQIGDIVSIPCKEYVYDLYREWANMYELTNWKAKHFPKPTQTGVITVKSKHTLSNKVIYGIKMDDGIDVITDERGIKLIKHADQLDDDLFTL